MSPADSLVWNYYVTMPMPASTLALAVGYWCQVTAETPPVQEKEVEVGADCDKPIAGFVELTELGLGGSSSEVLKGTQLQIGRYLNVFPLFFFFL